MAAQKNIRILEVGMRDGLQILPEFVPTDFKLQLLDGLLAAGCQCIQVTSFVSGKKIPALSDADALVTRLPDARRAWFSALVLNEKGVERAAAAGIRRVEATFSTTETHSRRNVSRSLAETELTLKRVLATAKRYGMVVRGGLQCVWGCVYDGLPPMERIERMVAMMVDSGADSVSLADSTGMASPETISRYLERVFAVVGSVPVALHLHNTHGRGYLNMLAGLRMGIRQFDTSFGGIGGCPAIVGATGNIATEKAVELAEQSGYQTGIDVASVSQISKVFKQWLGSHSCGGQTSRQRA